MPRAESIKQGAFGTKQAGCGRVTTTLPVSRNSKQQFLQTERACVYYSVYTNSGFSLSVKSRNSCFATFA